MWLVSTLMWLISTLVARFFYLLTKKLLLKVFGPLMLEAYATLR
jgi:hypothetical protein